MWVDRADSSGFSLCSWGLVLRGHVRTVFQAFVTDQMGAHKCRINGLVNMVLTIVIVLWRDL
jgi:hypothetical protein